MKHTITRSYEFDIPIEKISTRQLKKWIGTSDFNKGFCPTTCNDCPFAGLKVNCVEIETGNIITVELNRRQNG